MATTTVSSASSPPVVAGATPEATTAATLIRSDLSVRANGGRAGLAASALENSAMTTSDVGSDPNEAFRSLFGSDAVGPCHGVFSCSQNRIRGRLYLGVRSVFFYSNLLGFERKVCLHYRDVANMELIRTTSIQITMNDGEQFLFRSFNDRENVLQLLKRLKTESSPRKARRAAPSSTGAAAARTTARMSQTLPLTPGIATTTTMGTGEAYKNENTSDITDRQGSFPSSRRLKASISARSFDEYSSAHTEADEAQDGSLATSPFGDNRRRAASDSQLTPLSLWQDENATSANMGTSIDRTQNGNSQEQESDDAESVYYDGADDEDNHEIPGIKLEWENVKKWNVPYTEVVGIQVGNISRSCDCFFAASYLISVSWTSQYLELPCSLDQFFRTFLADGAPYSMERFQMEVIGDHSMELTRWTGDGENETHASATNSKRTISFTHVIKNSYGMGPSEAPTTRQQTLRRFDDMGLSLESRTTIKGIPAGDAFFVQDHWLIEGIDSETVVLQTRFGTRFTKRALLRGIIEKAIAKEYKEWFTSYGEFAVKALQEKPIVENEEIKAARAEPPFLPSEADALLAEIAGTLQRIERSTRRTSFLVVLVAIIFFMVLLWQLSTLHELLWIAKEEAAILRMELDFALKALESYRRELAPAPSCGGTNENPCV